VGRHPDSTNNSKQIPNRPSDEEIERQILSRVGSRVHFKYPGDEGSRHGFLKDRVVIRSTEGFQGIPYWDVVDLIEFPGAPEPDWMRVGYYRYTKGRLVWGSQTSLTDSLSVWRRLFVAAKSRSWFAPLLRV
jgi:hypothetical protein